MKKRIFYLISILSCMFFLASCGEKSTEEVLNSTLDKLNSIESVDESLIISSTLANSSPINININTKAVPKDSKFYSTLSADIMFVKFNMAINSTGEKVLVKFNDLFPKYIDMTNSPETKEILKATSKTNFFSSSSEDDGLFKSVFDEAKKNNTELTKIKKSINGSEQTLQKLSSPLNNEELTNALKSAVEESIVIENTDILGDSSNKDILDSLEISDANMDTYINKDYIPVYTEITFKTKIGTEPTDCKVQMTINDYNSEISFPEVDDSEIATPEELSNSPFSNMN